MGRRYILQPYRGMWSRYNCPQCNRHKVFVRYIDTQTGEPIADDVGRCNREANCGYHYTPAQHFSRHGKPNTLTDNWKPLTARDFEPSYLPATLLRQTVKNYEHNNLVQYLADKFGHDVAYTQARLYLTGTSNHWPGATIFWQVDGKGYIRTGKIMLYNAQTGRRVKQPFNHIAWVHKLSQESLAFSLESEKTKDSRLWTKDFDLKQCLFGEHLLQYEPGKAVAICESEKTAIMASVLYPKLIWLAAGSLQGLNTAKCKYLSGRKVILVPDVNAYDKWVIKARQLSAELPLVNFSVMSLLEDAATAQQKADGWDLADYL